LVKNAKVSQEQTKVFHQRKLRSKGDKMNFEEEFTNESALISGEMILESLGTMMQYYPLVLGSALRKLSELSGQPVQLVLSQLEQEHNLVGVLQSSKDKLSASKEVLGFAIEKIAE
jgi:hypothetical protein